MSDRGDFGCWKGKGKGDLTRDLDLGDGDGDDVWIAGIEYMCVVAL